jgi:hypothetical protein
VRLLSGVEMGAQNFQKPVIPVPHPGGHRRIKIAMLYVRRDGAGMGTSTADAERSVIMWVLCTMHHSLPISLAKSRHSRSVRPMPLVPMGTASMASVGLCGGLGTGDGWIQLSARKAGRRFLHGLPPLLRRGYRAMTSPIPSAANSPVTAVPSVASWSAAGIASFRPASRRPPENTMVFLSNVMTAMPHRAMVAPSAASLRREAVAPSPFPRQRVQDFLSVCNSHISALLFPHLLQQSLHFWHSPIPRHLSHFLHLLLPHLFPPLSHHHSQHHRPPP